MFGSPKTKDLTPAQVKASLDAHEILLIDVREPAEFAAERIHGALVHQDGSLTYITPEFERPKLESMIRLAGKMAVWEEAVDRFLEILPLVKERHKYLELFKSKIDEQSKR